MLMLVVRQSVMDVSKFNVCASFLLFLFASSAVHSSAIKANREDRILRENITSAIKQRLYDEKVKIEGFHARLTRLVQVKNGTTGIDVNFLVAPASCSSKRNVTMVQLYISGCGDKFPWNRQLRAVDNCTAIYSQPNQQLIKVECKPIKGVEFSVR